MIELFVIPLLALGFYCAFRSPGPDAYQPSHTEPYSRPKWPGWRAALNGEWHD